MGVEGCGGVRKGVEGVEGRHLTNLTPVRRFRNLMRELKTYYHSHYNYQYHSHYHYNNTTTPVRRFRNLTHHIILYICGNHGGAGGEAGGDQAEASSIVTMGALKLGGCARCSMQGLL